MQNRDKLFNNEQFNEYQIPSALTDPNELLTGQLSSDELMRAQEIFSNLNPSSYESVISFGRDVQLKVQQFSSGLMQATRKADPLKVQKILEEMATQIERINPDDLTEPSGNFLTKLFRAKPKRTMQQTVSEYRKLSKHVDRLAIQLKHAQEELLMQQRQLNALFEENAFHFQELAIHIRAAQMKATELKHQTVEDLTAESELFGKALSAHNDMIAWVDQMLYNLQLSQEVARQSAFQIRMVQQTNQMLIEKVQASIMATIPLWQGQIGTILSIGNQQRAASMHKTFARSSEAITQRLDNARERIQHEAAKNATTNGSVSSIDIEQFKQTQLRLLDEIEEALKLELAQNN